MSILRIVCDGHWLKIVNKGEGEIQGKQLCTKDKSKVKLFDTEICQKTFE